MKKAAYVFITVLFLGSTFNSISAQWVDAIGGTSNERLNDMAVDANGNVYTIGLFESATLDFDPSSGTSNLTNAGQSDIFFAKYDSNGDLVWARGLGESVSENGSYGNGIAVDGSGNVYISGYFDGTVDFDPSGGISELTAVSDDPFFAKYDSDGNLVWAKNISGSSSGSADAIDVDASGNIYVGGYFYGTADFDPSGTSEQTSAGDADGYFAKYDSNGDLVWADIFGSTGNENVYAIKVDGSGNVYITGSFNGTVDFDPSTGTSNLIGGGNSNVFYAKYDSDGALVWAKGLASSTFYDSGNAIEIDGSGNVYITGVYYGTIDFDPSGGGTDEQTSNGSSEIFFAKYDSNGDYVWAKSVGGSSGDNGTDIDVDGSGNVYISGTFSGTVDFDPPGSTNELTSAGSGDIFFAKYDSNGDYVWAKNVGGTSSDYASTVVVDGSGYVYIGGYFFGTADFNPDAGTDEYTSNGGQDVFFARYTSIGTLEGFIEYSASLIGVYTSDLAWGDYDSDGDLDLVVTGLSSPTRYFRIYRNDSGTFTQVQDLTGFTQASVKWGDYDNDGDLDLVVAGYDGAYTSKIYRNDGSDTFTDISAPITGVSACSANWVDTDNDGSLDLFIAGGISGGTSSKLYRNDGSDTFTEVSTTITGVYRCSSDWGDYDNDGDMDLLLTGDDGSGGEVSKIYRNDGNNTFSDISASITQLEYSSCAWGDYDNDGDLDFIICGRTSTNAERSIIYRNDGSDTFTDISAGLTDVRESDCEWGDYDNDGDLDLVITGTNTSIIYRNDGSDTFTDISAGLTGVSSCYSNWGDFDNDGDLDLVVSGTDGSNDITKIYENYRNTSNTAPNAPTNLQTSVNDNSITFSWDKATDTETSQNGLTYNLVVGTTDGGSDVFSGMADLSNGYRRVPQMGNTNSNNSWTLDDLTGGQTYYWKVQTIDNAFEGSAFASGTSAQALPVELTAFAATQTEVGILLEWETATEVNNYGFEVQKSVVSSPNSEESWGSIGFVQGNGTTNSPKSYTFTDPLNLDLNPNLTRLDYRLKQIDNDGTFAYSKTIEIDLTTITSIEDEEIPTVYSLSQNYPNPFNPTTTINFGLPEQGFVSLRVYNIIGEEVTELINQELSPGNHQVKFDGGNLSSGLYIYRIDIKSKFSAAKKMLQVK